MSRDMLSQALAMGYALTEALGAVQRRCDEATDERNSALTSLAEAQARNRTLIAERDALARQVIEMRGPDPANGATWTCERCTQVNVGWAKACGRCNKER
jgi:hypothetical protein